MNKLEKYMNDPDIVNEPMAMREVHAIRLMIQDEQKDMSVEERMKRTSDSVKAVEEELGFKFRRPEPAHARKVM
jgi:hypothetical protein